MVHAHKTVVVVSKQWNSPAITVGISKDGITMHMTMDEFIASTVKELGTPLMVLTQAQLQKKLTDAAYTVQMEMHQSTTIAMAHQMKL